MTDCSGPCVMRACAKHAHHRAVPGPLSFSRRLSRWQPVPQPEAARPSPPQGSGLVSPPAGRGLTATTALPRHPVPRACALGGGRLPLGSPGPRSSPWVRGSRGGWGPGGEANGSDRGQARAAGRLSLVHLTLPRAGLHSPRFSPSRGEAWGATRGP